MLAQLPAAAADAGRKVIVDALGGPRNFASSGQP